MIFQLILAKAGKLVHQENLGNADSSEVTLLLGLISAMNSLAQSIGPISSRNFNTLITGEYKLHYFETPSKYQFIIFSSTDTRDLHEEMRNIYAQLFIPLVLRNPSFERSCINFKETCPVFVNRLRSNLIAIPPLLAFVLT
jgi:Sybindin-like family